MKALKISGVCLILLATQGIYGQSKIDSLRRLISNTSSDSIVIQATYHLAQQYKTIPDSALLFAKEAMVLAARKKRYSDMIYGRLILSELERLSTNFDSAIHHLLEADTLAKNVSISDFKAKIHSEFGHIYREQSKWNESIEAYQKALQWYEKNMDQYGQAETNDALGNVHLDQHQFYPALTYYQKSSQLHTKNSVEYATAIRNIALIYFRLKDFDKSDEYLKKALLLSNQHTDLKLKGAVLQQMGILQRALGNFDQVLPYYEESLKAFEQVENTRKVAQLQSNIGNLYLDLKDFEKAMEYYHKALDVQLRTANLSGQCFTLIAIGMAHSNLGQTEMAIEKIMEAKVLAEQIGVQLIAMDATGFLSDIYLDQKDYKRAYEYHVAFKAISDSIFNQQKSAQIAEVEAKYQTVQKEKEINLLNAENKINQFTIAKSENQRNYLVAISIFILILAFSLYSRYRMRTKANQKLEELDSFKTRFFTNVSHEFRTPLTLIIGPLERMLKKETDKNQLALYGVMYNNANRLLELINQLLDLSKLEAGSLKLNVSKSDINLFISTLCHSFWSLAEQHEIHFKIDVPSTSHFLWFDKDKVQKVIYNLISNAFKFTPKGGQVLVKIIINDEWYEIQVIDTGIGIPKHKLSSIFERFNQANVEDTNTGTGIGLALTKELVSLHKSKLEVSSEPSKGSVFSVSLPMNSNIYDVNEKVSSLDDNTTVHAINISSNYEEVNHKEESGSYIMVVDDNKDIRRYVRSIFSDDYVVIEAENGRAGLELAIEKLPDLIISDLMMPEMDGLAFCQHIKSNELTSHIPVVLLTAKADFDSKIHGLEMGADDYVLKPFEEKELKVRTQNLLKQRKQLRERYAKMIYLEPSEIAIGHTDEVFIRKAQEIVEKNIPNFEFSVEQFQKEIGMSRMQLHRKLKGLMNCSTSEFIRDQRLQRAAQLLNTKSVNVSEAAYQSGFNNLSYFAKCFKDKFGKQPSQYIEN